LPFLEAFSSYQQNDKENTSMVFPSNQNCLEVSHVKKSMNQTTEGQGIFEFKTGIAQKAFNFLLDAFVEDYMRSRIAQQKAGWRSLMEIVRQGKMTKFSIYGREGRSGQAISELERRGLVEARFFTGERGRGGKIMKLRVSYEPDVIKRQIEGRIMERKK
jgi:hypothetical protein